MLLGGAGARYDLVRVVGDWDGNRTADVMARRRSTGALWFWPGRGDGTLTTARQVGTGWNGIRELVATGRPGRQRHRRPARRPLVRRLAVDLPGHRRGRLRGRCARSATGWAGRDLLTSAGDWDGDGSTDLISRETSTGLLWLTRGNGLGGLRHVGRRSAGLVRR